MISDDGTLQAPRICAALVGERKLHAARSRGTPPPYRPLSRLSRRPKRVERKSQRGETTGTRRTRTAQLSVLNTKTERLRLYVYL